mmetsp:Transcript_62105/g.178698  ORF Transcript_62105/g.178698 Transcript_62105/m.178698 type:complete len:205 (+) Transcript_62105:226-840(+)
MEEFVVLCAARRRAFARASLQHAPHEREAAVADVRAGLRDLGEASRAPLRVIWVPIRQLGHARPHFLCWGPACLEDKEERLDLRPPREQRLTQEHLRKDTTGRPNVDLLAISRRSVQQLRRAVPKRDDVERIAPVRKVEVARETEITYLQHVVLDQHIRRLQVAVQDATCMALVHALEQLPPVPFYHAHGHRRLRLPVPPQVRV